MSSFRLPPGVAIREGVYEDLPGIRAPSGAWVGNPHRDADEARDRRFQDLPAPPRYQAAPPAWAEAWPTLVRGQGSTGTRALALRLALDTRISPRETTGDHLPPEVESIVPAIRRGDDLPGVQARLANLAEDHQASPAGPATRLLAMAASSDLGVGQFGQISELAGDVAMARQTLDQRPTTIFQVMAMMDRSPAIMGPVWESQKAILDTHLRRIPPEGGVVITGADIGRLRAIMSAVNWDPGREASRAATSLVESPIHRAALRDELAAAVSGPETVRPPVIYEQVRVPDLAADRQRILGPVLRSRLSQIDPVLAEVYRARVHNWVLRQPTSIGRTLEAHAYQGVT